MIRHLLGCALLAALTVPSWAQTPREDDTPPIVQVTLGPTYLDLPEDGGMYCVPTSHTMALFWLSRQGFTSLAPAFTTEAGYNLDRVIAGLMGTGNGTKGGTTGEGERTGMTLYLNLQGFAGNFSGTAITAPQSADIAGALAGPYDIGIINIAWYKYSGTGNLWTQNSGHDVTLLNYQTLGADSGTATINNPEPRALEPVMNEPSQVKQTLSVQALSGVTLVGADPGNYLQFINSTHTGTASDHLAVINAVDHWSITADPGNAPATFVLTQTETVFTNGGNFTAVAPLDDGAGDFGIIKSGAGTMTLSGSSNTTSGTWQVQDGSLASTLTTDGLTAATPFGTGDMIISGGGVLFFTPELSSAAPEARDVALLLASGENRQLTVGAGQSTLQVDRGGNDRVTLTIGGHTTGTFRNVELQDNGTLLIQASDGLGALGGTTRILVQGGTANQPVVVNGIFDPAVIGRDGDADASGSFLTYSEADGFTLAAVTSGSSLAGTTSTTVFATTAAIAVAADTTVTVAALQVNADITGGSNSELRIMPDLSVNGGLILNGAEIAVERLNFGDRNAYIYSSQQGGAVSSVITAETLTTFGPGETALSGSSAAISGTVYVNSGTLSVANQGIGDAGVQVRQNAVLSVSGTVGGQVSVGDGGTLSLNGGEVTGTLLLSSNSTLAGTGNISYGADTTLEGNLGSTDVAGRLNFAASAGTPTLTLADGAVFNFTLASTGGNTPGVDWNFFHFADTVASTDLVINLNFLSGTDPENPANAAYWAVDHEWNLMDFAQGDAPDQSSLSLPGGTLYTSGTVPNIGTFSTRVHDAPSGGGKYVSVIYTAVPEPSALALAAIGGIGLLLLLRRRPMMR